MTGLIIFIIAVFALYHGGIWAISLIPTKVDNRSWTREDAARQLKKSKFTIGEIIFGVIFFGAVFGGLIACILFV